MSRRMTPKEGRSWAKRWQRVRAAEVVELRRTPPEVRLRQLAALMDSVGPLGWSEALADGEAEVRARWIKLRKAYGVQE